MKNAFRTSALFCAVACLSLSLSVAPARAADDSAVVRAAQMDLASMGYYVGRYDGIMGPVTVNAIMDFQRRTGLPATGQLTAMTYDRLSHGNYTAWHPELYGSYEQGYASVYAMPGSVAWDDRWHYVRSETIPSRFAKLNVMEDDRGAVRHYAVTLNGQPVLIAENQTYILRVSKTYAMDKEDAVIFTAYQGDGSCTYKNYLLTIHNDGTFGMPRQIGDCAGHYEAHVSDNALFVSFPGIGLVTGLSTWDVWRYENGTMFHI